MRWTVVTPGLPKFWIDTRQVFALATTLLTMGLKRGQLIIEGPDFESEANDTKITRATVELWWGWVQPWPQGGVQGSPAVAVAHDQAFSLCIDHSGFCCHS